MINNIDDYRILISRTIKQPKSSNKYKSMLTSYFQFRIMPLPSSSRKVDVVRIEDVENYMFFIEEFKSRYYIVERIEDTSQQMQAHILEYIRSDKQPERRKKTQEIIDWKIRTLENNLELKVGDYISSSGIFFRIPKKELDFELEEMLQMLYKEYPKEIGSRLLRLLAVEVTDFIHYMM